MPATTFGIVYSTASGAVRRIVLPDSDAELHTLKLASGESLHIAPSGPTDLATCEAIIKTATGLTPSRPTCAIVDGTNTVVGVIRGEAALDSIAGHTLVDCYAPIPVGSTYSAATKLFTAPVTMLAASLEKNRPTAVLVPASVIANPTASAL